jgi:hypothetical protein
MAVAATGIIYYNTVQKRNRRLDPEARAIKEAGNV